MSFPQALQGRYHFWVHLIRTSNDPPPECVLLQIVPYLFIKIELRSMSWEKTNWSMPSVVAINMETALEQCIG
jgi:hypothetical protein